MSKFLLTTLLGATGCLAAFGATPAQGLMKKAKSASTVPVHKTKASVKTQAKAKAPQKAPSLNIGHRSATPFLSPKPVKGADRALQQSMRASNAAEEQIIGSLVYAASWNATQEAEYGMYSFTTTSPTLENLVLGEEYFANTGMVCGGGKLFIAQQYEFWGMVFETYYIYDSETLEPIAEVNGDTDFYAYCMTYDGHSGKAFGFFVDPSGDYGYLGSMDMDTYEVTRIKNYTDRTIMMAMVTDADGTLYAIEKSGDLLKVNKTTGNLTNMGNLGVSSQYTTGACFSPKTGACYFAVCDDAGSALYNIDLAEVSASLLYEFTDEEEFAGLYINGQQAPDGVPATPANLTVTTEEGSLSCMVGFDIPEVTYDGKTLSGKVEYTVLLNGEPSKTGTGNAGDHINTVVTASTSGPASVAVQLENAAGYSPVALWEGWIGADSLLPPGNVNLNYSNGTFTLTWTPAAPEHEGYIDPSKLTYTVTRYPGGTVVAEGLTGTSYSEAVDIPAEIVLYYYTVEAVYDGVAGQPVKSNGWTLGDLVPPFHETFDDEMALDQFTTIDGNADGQTWVYEEGKLAMIYNDKKAMDDYLVLPPLRLEGGKAYEISFDAWSKNPYYLETVECVAGTSPTTEALTEVIIAPTDLDWEEPTQLAGMYLAPADGVYYIAVHGISAPDMYRLYIDNLSVSAPRSADVPNPVTDLTAKAADYGEMTVTLTMTAPSATLSGNSLDEVDILLSRNGSLINELTVSGGHTFSYTDRNSNGAMVNGMNTYTAVASTSSGESVPVTVEVRVGLDMPSDVAWINVAEGDNAGQKFVTWAPVTTDINGMTYGEGQVTYKLMRVTIDGPELVYDGTATGYADQVIGADDEQLMLYYGVYAVYGDYSSDDVAVSNITMAGKPYELPFVETFANCRLTHMWGTEGSEDGEWTLFSDSDVSGVVSATGDDGFACFYAQYIGEEGRLFSGLINMDSEETSTLAFQYFAFDSTNVLELQVNAGNGWETLKEIDIYGDYTWQPCIVDMSAYKGKNIQVAFYARIVDKALVAVDDLRIGKMSEYDLAAGKLAAPAKVKADEKFTLQLDVTNYGSQSAVDWTATLYCNGNPVQTVEGPELESMASCLVDFTQTLNMTAETADYYAVVDYAADQNPDDNTSATVVVKVVVPSFPAPGDLSAQVTGEGNVILNWAVPAKAEASGSHVDGAEDYPAFSTGMPGSQVEDDNLGDWLSLDLDGVPAYGVQNADFPNMGTTQGWIVFNPALAGFKESSSSDSNTYDGDQVFACFASEAGVNDDWLISPELTGKAQTISFKGRSYTDDYGLESFEVLYSTTGREPSDFVKVGSVSMVPVVWSDFEYELPDGALYFAIRCVSEDRWILLVDDIEFSTPADLAEIELEGYNVYRNGQKLNEAPLTAPEYLDMTAQADTEYTYAVTAVYNMGESGISNTVGVMFTGVEAVKCGVSVKAGRGVIEINGALSPVSVASADGKLIATGTGSSLTVKAAAGIYTVTSGRQAWKVIVK